MPKNHLTNRYYPSPTDKRTLEEYRIYVKEQEDKFKELESACDQLTKPLLAEHGVDLTGMTTKDMLFCAMQLLKKRNTLLRNITKEIEMAKKKEVKDLQQFKTTSGELSLTREELKAMGISLKSNIIGKFTSLPPELKSKIHEEIAAVMVDKMTMILDSIDVKKIKDTKNVKDACLAIGILFDKIRIAENKSTKNVEVKHSLSDLVRKNNETNLTSLDLSGIKEVDVVEIEKNDVENEKIEDEFEEIGD